MAAITLPKAKMETENYPLGSAHILLPRHFEDNVCFPKMGYVRSQKGTPKETGKFFEIHILGMLF